MAVRVRVSRKEFMLVREALEYVGRRIAEPGDALRAAALRERVEMAITRGRPSERLWLSDDQARILRTVIDSYRVELDRPSSDISNRARVARLRAIDQRLMRAGSWLGRLFGFLGGH